MAQTNARRVTVGWNKNYECLAFIARTIVLVPYKWLYHRALIWCVSHLGRGCRTTDSERKRMPRAHTLSQKLKTLKSELWKWENWNSKANRFLFNLLRCHCVTLSTSTIVRDDLTRALFHIHPLFRAKNGKKNSSNWIKDDDTSHRLREFFSHFSINKFIIRIERTPAGSQTCGIRITCFIFNLAARARSLVTVSMAAGVGYAGFTYWWRISLANYEVNRSAKIDSIEMSATARSTHVLSSKLFYFLFVFFSYLAFIFLIEVSWKLYSFPRNWKVYCVLIMVESQMKEEEKDASEIVVALKIRILFRIMENSFMSLCISTSSSTLSSNQSSAHCVLWHS